jgi:hypothetical protein
VHVGLEVRLYGVEEVIKVFCSAAVQFWMGQIDDLGFHCFLLNRLCALFLVCFHQLGFLHT